MPPQYLWDLFTCHLPSNLHKDLGIRIIPVTYYLPYVSPGPIPCMFPKIDSNLVWGSGAAVFEDETWVSFHFFLITSPRLWGPETCSIGQRISLKDQTLVREIQILSMLINIWPQVVVSLLRILLAAGTFHFWSLEYLLLFCFHSYLTLLP